MPKQIIYLLNRLLGTQAQSCCCCRSYLQKWVQSGTKERVEDASEGKIKEKGELQVILLPWGGTPITLSVTNH